VYFPLFHGVHVCTAGGSAGAMGPCPPSRCFGARQCPNVVLRAAVEAGGPPRVWTPPRGARSQATPADVQPPRPLAQIGHSSCDARCVTHVSATRTAVPGHDTSFAGAPVRGARVAGARVAPRQNAKCRWCMESGNSIYYQCSLTLEPRREAALQSLGRAKKGGGPTKPWTHWAARFALPEY